MNRTFHELQSHPPYAMPSGDTEIVVVSDGPLDLGAPEGSFRGPSREEPLLASGGKRILFETGIGSLKMFGPPTG
jgi:hypothetical protein